LRLGGSIISLSSIYVHCSLRGTAIDLGGPLANLVLGLIALLAARMAGRASSAMRLFLILTAGFNLLWFALQLVFSAATRTDDWAWAMHQFQITGPLRWGMVATGALAYLWTVRVVAAPMASFAHPLERARTVVRIAWFTAGATALAIAAFDHSAIAAISQHALPQAVLNAIGLLFVPRAAAKMPVPDTSAAPLVFSMPWVAAAAVVGLASIVLLGPGVAIGGF
jgi:hypothetical protein